MYFYTFCDFNPNLRPKMKKRNQKEDYRESTQERQSPKSAGRRLTKNKAIKCYLVFLKTKQNIKKWTNVIFISSIFMLKNQLRIVSSFCHAYIHSLDSPNCYDSSDFNLGTYLTGNCCRIQQPDVTWPLASGLIQRSLTWPSEVQSKTNTHSPECPHKAWEPPIVNIYHLVNDFNQSTLQYHVRIYIL